MGSKLAEESEATLDQAVARDFQNSTMVSSTPVALDMDVEMTTVVALPVGELREGQIYHLVDSRLVVYDQAHSNTPALLQKHFLLPLKSQQCTWRLLEKSCQLDQPPQIWRKNWPSCQPVSVGHHRAR
jgi:hypothetical protein